MDIETKYGLIRGVARYDTYDNGQVNECELAEKNEIETAYGTFVPQYSADEGLLDRRRKRRSSIQFYSNGEIKAIALEERVEIDTPAGTFPAELVTFNKDGSLKKVFPLNGMLNGFWTEENEGEMLESYDFSFPFATFKAKIISVTFYKSGKVRSLTLWPGEQIKMKTPAGEMLVRIGFSLYEDGSIKSVEPGAPTSIITPIGEIIAFDNDAIGVHGESNSVKFSQEGELTEIKTVENKIAVVRSNGKMMLFKPRLVDSYTEESEKTMIPLKIGFSEGKIHFHYGQVYSFEIDQYTYSISKNDEALTCAGGCGSCTACH